MSVDTLPGPPASPIGVEKVLLETDSGLLEHEERRWGVPLKDMYRLGLRFYKEMEGKAMQLSYEDRLRLVAYTQQAAHGPLDDKTSPPPGVLDVIGKDRRAAWLALKDMSKIQAMASFLQTLDRLCPLFKAYAEAIQKEAEDKELQENQKKREEEEKKCEEIRANLDQDDDEERVRRVKEALNAQTYAQFVEYAAQQCPTSVEQQAVLVRQLQEQHYRQYVQQLALDTRLASVKLLDTPDTKDLNTEQLLKGEDKQEDEKHEESERERDSEQEESDDGLPHVEEARIWTRTELAAFKESVRAAAGGRGVLTVGHGETVTVRVPTHKAGSCLFWELATDGFDLGFGVYFEWGASPTCEVTVTVAESDEEDDEEDYGEDEEPAGGDVERGGGGEAGAALAAGAGAAGAATALKPPVSVVVPVFRRDCHLKVYAGSHPYPGEGVYLLKFDNTYSLWRSKTLYYKVYYTH